MSASDRKGRSRSRSKSVGRARSYDDNMGNDRPRFRSRSGSNDRNRSEDRDRNREQRNRDNDRFRGDRRDSRFRIRSRSNDRNRDNGRYRDDRRDGGGQRDSRGEGNGGNNHGGGGDRFSRSRLQAIPLNKDMVDQRLAQIADDPRVKGGLKMVTIKGGGRNTVSFDPASTLVRPDMRIIVGLNREVLGNKIKQDDVIVVPEFFCKEDDWSIYYKLIEEMREVQANEEENAKVKWESWAEGAHLNRKDPEKSPF